MQTLHTCLDQSGVPAEVNFGHFSMYWVHALKIIHRCLQVCVSLCDMDWRYGKNASFQWYFGCNIKLSMMIIQRLLIHISDRGRTTQLVNFRWPRQEIYDKLCNFSGYILWSSSNTKEILDGPHKKFTTHFQISDDTLCCLIEMLRALLKFLRTRGPSQCKDVVLPV